MATTFTVFQKAPQKMVLLPEKKYGATDLNFGMQTQLDCEVHGEGPISVTRETSLAYLYGHTLSVFKKAELILQPEKRLRLEPQSHTHTYIYIYIHIYVYIYVYLYT